MKGYHRSFCLKTELGRGTPEKPGLMAGLDQGGDCIGLVFRIDRDLVDAESRLIWRCEMLLHAYSPTFLYLAKPRRGTCESHRVIDRGACAVTPCERNLL